MLEFFVPSRSELYVRQAWLADPEFMSYNAGWDVDYPGYDGVTGCIDWPESQWAAFEDRLRLPADRQGYFYVRDTTARAVIGHAHYEVDGQGAAHIGINVVPAWRGRGVGERVLRLLVERIWRDTAADQIVNEFEDDRTPAVRTHLRCGFVPDAEMHDDRGRPTRTWRCRRTDE